MNADTLQQHEDHGRRWAAALLAIGERPGQVKADALAKIGLVGTTADTVHTPSARWCAAALAQVECYWSKSYAFLAGAFAACEESTR